MPNQTSSTIDESSPSKAKKFRWGPPKNPRRVAQKSNIAIIPRPTSKAIDARLDNLCLHFQKSLKGHRNHLYDLMRNVAAIKVLLDQRYKVRTDFVRSLRKKKGYGGSARPEQKLNLFTELMARATGARSRGARQLAFKRGRVIEILLESGLMPEDIPATIKKRRGIERIYAEGTHSHSGSDQLQGAASTGEENPSVPSRNLKSNDHETVLTVRIRASDRDGIFENAGVGSQIKTLILRVGKGNSDFKITKVKLIPATRVEEEEDWSD
jgi:hypothetical protein